MKRQVRRGVFETNSSSMHSLTVMKKDEKYTPEEIAIDFCLWDDEDTGEEDCVWRVDREDITFGRMPFRALGTFKKKWLYAYASLVIEYKDEFHNELVTLALKYVPNLKKIKLPTKTYSIANESPDLDEDDDFCLESGKTEEEFLAYISQKENDWGIEINYWEDEGWWKFKAPDTGYVDESILHRFLERNKVSLEDFLTNKKYVVIQDGDEYCYWNDMKKTGLVNMEAIDYEYTCIDKHYDIEEEDYEETNQM